MESGWLNSQVCEVSLAIQTKKRAGFYDHN